MGGQKEACPEAAGIIPSRIELHLSYVRGEFSFF
jgi:hypothetical protein